MKAGLEKCDNAVIVPHIASASFWTRAGMVNAIPLFVIGRFDSVLSLGNRVCVCICVRVCVCVRVSMCLCLCARECNSAAGCGRRETTV